MKRVGIFCAAVSVIGAGALIEACGLDDSVVVEMGPASGSQDATVGSDVGIATDTGIPTDDAGHKLLPDGAIDPGDDAAVALDAGDASFPDATASDGGPCPSGQSRCATGASSTCVTNCAAQCSGSSLSCSGASASAGGAACVSDCTTCGTHTTQCFRCERSSSFAAVGTCEEPGNSSSCIKDGNYLHCACFGYQLSSCPGTTQVCRPTFILGVGACKTCGESNSKGQDCKGGGKCDTANGTCH
ncbi:MAG: hypothetical protein ABI461_15150 [Polyangiaceae bacterium]